MLVRRVTVENVRSFLERTELVLDGPITIIIGPNGGGKTNLLDTIVIMLRRYLFASMYAVHASTPEHRDRYEFRYNDVLKDMVLEPHSAAGKTRDQLVEIEVEVTSNDVENMRSIQNDVDHLTELARQKYVNFNIESAKTWKLKEIAPGTRFIYRVRNGALQQNNENTCTSFLQYLQIFEMHGMVRKEFELAPLTEPLVYLHANRSSSGFQSNVELAGYDDFQTKRHSDGVSSRSTSSIVNLAVGRLAQRFRLLLEKDRGAAADEFRSDANLKELTKLLRELGYEWSLECVSPLKNKYDVRIKKQGSTFLVGAASSGERELLTYLFAIFALNVSNALIIVDEPELHIHPKWQKILFELFVRLAKSTGNRFLLATHSPTFVSPESIQYVSRVFTNYQRSHILRLNTAALPEAKHLLNIVNSQNNERLFFADEVVLVEGLSDRMFFEAVLDRYGRSASSRSILEVISVGGKGFFEAYAKVLRACEIRYSIISDLDYVEQVGSPEIRALFEINAQEIKKDVIENIKSLDGNALVQAVEQALNSGSWDHATQVWAYIKARRRQLRTDMSQEDMAALATFLAQKRKERVYILSRGALEAYLPVGHGSKDLDKLIRFLAQTDFWDQLPESGKAELELIVQCLLPKLGHVDKDLI